MARWEKYYRDHPEKLKAPEEREAQDRQSRPPQKGTTAEGDEAKRKRAPAAKRASKPKSDDKKTAWMAVHGGDL
jgi:hypothetical protein